MNKKCNHNPVHKDTTLKAINIYKMINPMRYNFFCECCKKTFTFVKDSKGELIEVEKEEDN